jgi:hypothetical protein
VKEGRAARRPPHTIAVVEPPRSTEASLTRLAGRAKYYHRLGTIERAWVLYGEQALLPPSPAGPAECPPRCEYCSGLAVVA